MADRWGFTVFVDNLPFNLDRFGLKGIFQRAGYVRDTFIQAKLSRSRKRFGFVRFGCKVDAEKSINRLNGIRVRGFQIRVCRARYGNGGRRVGVNEASKQELKMGSRKLWREKRSSADRLNQSLQDVVATIKGEQNGVFLEWLNRSLICASNESWDLEALSQALVEAGCSKVRALSKFQFVLTFQSIKQKVIALQNHAILANWFHEVKEWSIYEVCETRRFWLEVFGVPPHGWTLKNFESIASFWGNLVCLETPVEDVISFESMKILVEGNCFQEVKGHIILHIGDAGYKIMVKEANCSFNINPQFIVPSSSSAGVKVATVGTSEPALHEQVQGDRRISNLNLNLHQSAVREVGLPRESRSDNINSVAVLVRGKGQLERQMTINTKTAQLSAHQSEAMNKQAVQGDDVEASVDVISQHWANGGKLEDGRSEGAIRSTPSFKSDGKDGQHEASIESTTKTKSAQFSHNVCSEEVIMNFNKDPASHNLEVNGHIEPPNLTGPFTHHMEGSGEPSAPPGFEALKPGGAVPKQCITDGSVLQGLSARRVTRSQAKRDRELGSRIQKQQKQASKVPAGSRSSKAKQSRGSPQASKSPDTTESIAKLAKESLDIGELLGLKIVGNKEGAVKGLISSLKNQRKR